MLEANGFHEADVFLNQPHVHNELVIGFGGASKPSREPKLSRSVRISFGSESLAASKSMQPVLDPACPSTSGGVSSPRPDSQSEPQPSRRHGGKIVLGGVLCF
jgi:hypothetical protein